MLTLGTLNRLDGVRHAFFSREGGVSEGLYASLNCGLGSGDALTNVLTNRANAAAQLDVAADSLLTCYQVHGIDVVNVTAPWSRENLPRADAMVTKEPA